MTDRDAPPPYPYVARGMSWIGLALVCAGLCLGAYYVYTVLRYGHWYHYPLTELFADAGLGYPHVSWVGVQRLIDFIMQCPTGIVSFVLGIAIFGGTLKPIDDYTNANWAYVSRKRQEARKAATESEPAPDAGLETT